MTGRRQFVGAIAIGAAFVRLAGAQPAARVYRIGFLEAGTAAANQHFVDAFVRALRELGYEEGKNVTIDVRWGEGKAERFPGLLRELVRLKPDVIVVASTLGAVAAKQVVTSIPVVMVAVSDPSGMKLVGSLAHPGGNMTGTSREFGQGLIGKALQMLKEVAPGIERVAILWDVDGEVEPRFREAETAVRSMHMTPIPLGIRTLGQLDEMRRNHADALMVVTDPLTLRNRETIVRFANDERIPAVYEFGEFARSGGLIAYSASVPALFARSAVYVDKILRGANPGDLPIEQPTTFELVINLKTARLLGVGVPQSLLLQADEVIQ
jgi:putative tryptophan/tyrosine transport system substrate-binding protein